MHAPSQHAICIWSQFFENLLRSILWGQTFVEITRLCPSEHGTVDAVDYYSGCTNQKTFWAFRIQTSEDIGQRLQQTTVVGLPKQNCLQTACPDNLRK